MKKITLVVLLLVAGTAVTFAQCEKSLTLTSSKTVYLDDKGTIVKTDDESALIEVTKTGVTITHGAEDHQLKGVITATTCNWKVPFKEGKSVIKTTLNDEGGNEKHATLTIEGKDGKVILTYEEEEEPGRKIQITANKFAEKA